MKNPFRNEAMRKSFDIAVSAYEKKSGNLFQADGTPHEMNSLIARHFWAGYEGRLTNSYYEGSKNSPSYAIFRAGQLIAKAEKDEDKWLQKHLK